MRKEQKLLNQAAKDFGLKGWKLYARPSPKREDEHVLGRAIIDPQFRRAIVHLRPPETVRLASDAFYYPGATPEEVVYHEVLHVVAVDCGFARCFEAVAAHLRGIKREAEADALVDACEVLLSRMATAMIQKGKHV